MPAPLSSSHADLLLPTLLDYEGREGRVGQRPWRLGSMIYVAFFGGVLAATWIAAHNARRLRAEHLVPGLWVRGALAYLVSTTGAAWMLSTGAEALVGRNLHRAVALLLYFGFHRLLARADRSHVALSGSYDSLWKPGLLAVFGLGTLEGLVTYFLVRGVLS